MRLFLSWSGERSKAMGAALAKWIPMVVQRVQPWYSPQSIEKGSRWQQELTKELETINFAVVCVTPENLTAPWLLYESGAVSKNLQGKLFTALIDIQPTEVTGPLSSFQHTSLQSQSDVLELIKSINKHTDAPLGEPQLIHLFNVLWPALQTDLAAIPLPPLTVPDPKRTHDEMLEELVERTRGLERQMQAIDTRVSNLRRDVRAFPPREAIFGRAERHSQMERFAVFQQKITALQATLARTDLEPERRLELEAEYTRMKQEYDAVRRSLGPYVTAGRLSDLLEEKNGS